jgi:hypothetical protein
VDAFFVGWDKQVPLLIWEKVHLRNVFPFSVSTSEQVLPPRELAYTTNGITQEIIEGTSSHSNRVAAQWKKLALKLPKHDLDWRRIEFFIKATGDQDDTVGQKVNLLEIPAGGKAAWLQNLTCRP